MTPARLLFFSIFLLIASFKIYSQGDICVKGLTSSSKNDFYYVVILSSRDSTMLSSAYFDTPEFALKGINEQDFIVRVYSPMLFKDYIKNITNKEKLSVIDLGFIQLEPIENKLAEVQVTAALPKIQFKDGKYLHNIQGNTDFMTLESVNDILKRLPLVSVENEKIGVLGKKNTIILINGLQPKNDNWDLIPPENIKTIEVITNPSAEYSASGMAVINIITKKRFSEGFNGILASSISKGEFWRSANNLQLGYSKDRINFFSNFNYNPNKRKFVDSYERHFVDGNKMFNDLIQDRQIKNNYNALLGLEYSINNKNIIGLQYQRTYLDVKSDTKNINDIYTPSELNKYKTLRNTNAPITRNIYDLNYLYIIDSIGKSLNINMGYVDYISKDNSSFWEFSSIEKEKKSSSNAKIKLYTTNIDYVHKTNSNFTGKVGLVYSHNKNNSSNILEDIKNGNSNIDEMFTNTTNISENKFATYLTANKKWNKFNLSGGVRYEHINYKNNSTKDTQEKNYNNLFPSVDISYDVNKKLQTSLSYSRKVHYPKFQDLNPAIIYVDTVTYYIGNTNLQPEYSNNFSFNMVYNKQFVLSLGYSYIKDPLYMSIHPFETNSMIYVASVENLESEKSWTMSLSTPYRYKIWTTQNTLGINYIKNEFKNEDLLLKRNKNTFYLYSHNSFKLPYGFNFSVIYNYNSSGVNGIFYYERKHIVNLSLTKNLLKDNLSISLRADDILKEDKQKSWTNLNSVKFIYNAKYDASTIVLSAKFKFGKSTKKYEIKRNAKDELKRIK